MQGNLHGVWTSTVPITMSRGVTAIHSRAMKACGGDELEEERWREQRRRVYVHASLSSA